MNHRDVVILAGARTPQGRFHGQFTDLSAVELGAIAMRAAFERAGVLGESVDGAVVLTSLAFATEHGLPWLVRVGASGHVAGPDNLLHSQPAGALRAAAKRHGVEVAEFRLPRDQ